MADPHDLSPLVRMVSRGYTPQLDLHSVENPLTYLQKDLLQGPRTTTTKQRVLLGRATQIVHKRMSKADCHLALRLSQSSLLSGNELPTFQSLVNSLQSVLGCGQVIV